MYSMSSFIFLFPLFLSLCLSLRPPHFVVAIENNGTSSLIQKACDNSPYKDLCLSILSSHDSQNADLKGLASIALKVAAKNATDTSVRIKLWLSDKNIEPSVSDGLSNCDKEYMDAVNQIEHSVNAVASNGFDDAKRWMEDAIVDIETCEERIKGQGGYAVELSRENKVLRQLCSTALGIVYVLAPTI